MREMTRKEEQILLAIHRLDDNAYLITIREQIHNYTGKYYSVGTIYAPLNRLDIKGYIEARTGNAGGFGSKKPIKYYHLTPKGYQALRKLRELYHRMWNGLELSLCEEVSS
jgi:DNA-binding PadR family transcriptional regulator